MTQDDTIHLAGAVVRDGEGRVLLLHRVSPSQWEVPGGVVEPGEHPVEAAAREVREELGVGVDVEVEDEIGACVFIERGQKFHYTFFAAGLEGPPRAVEAMHDGIAYHDLQHVPESSPAVRGLLDLL